MKIIIILLLILYFLEATKLFLLQQETFFAEKKIPFLVKILTLFLIFIWPLIMIKSNLSFFMNLKRELYFEKKRKERIKNMLESMIKASSSDKNPKEVFEEFKKKLKEDE